MNLVAVANAEEKGVLWGFLKRYAPSASPESHPRLDALVGYAIRYFEDFVKPKKAYRLADDVESAAFATLADKLAAMRADATAEAIQEAAYDVARAVPRYQDFAAKGATPERPGVSNAWFAAIYNVLLGEERGPRFGSFAAIYGLENTVALLRKAIAGDLVAAHEAFLKSRGITG
jgi:lysyl-tRNA synthetase class 1